MDVPDAKSPTCENSSTPSTRGGEDEGAEVEIMPSDSGLLELPEDMLIEILHKQCARSEIVSRAVCRSLSKLMRTAIYESGRERMVDPQVQDPGYCCLLLSRSIQEPEISLGWDPVSEKWVSLPKLGFIRNASLPNYEVDSPIERLELHSVCCSDKGLLCVTIAHKDVMNPGGSTWLCTRQYYGIVCNPLTKSCVAITAPEQVDRLLLNFTVMRAGTCPGGSGFMLYGVANSAADHERRMCKLDSSNLDAGWQPLDPFPAAIKATLATDVFHNAPAPVVLDGVMYRLHICRQTFALLLVSYRIDAGLWAMDELTEAPLVRSEVDDDGRDDHLLKLSLLNVGSRLWLVQLAPVQSLTSQALTLANPPEDVELLESIYISRYEPQESKFTLVYTDHGPGGPLSLYRRVEGSSGRCKICFIPTSDEDPTMFDVITGKWVQCSNQRQSDRQWCHRDIRYCCFGGTFHLSRNSCIRLT